MGRPTFIVIGAAKCGTTSVCDLLGAHPDIFMSDPKEPHYFSRLTKYPQREEWYASLFPDGDDFEAIGEGSTSYTHPHRIDFVVPRIRRVLPDCRLIYMVRHPIRRLESDWKMRRREDRASSSISDAADRQASLITLGLYWKQLQRYREAFPDEQIAVVFLEDFAEDPLPELSSLYRHIGVDPTFDPDDPNSRRNASSDYRDPGVVARAIRRLPGYRIVRDLAPEGAVSAAKAVLTDEFDPSPEWDPAGLEAARSYFREDARQLLEHCGKPADFWQL